MSQSKVTNTELAWKVFLWSLGIVVSILVISEKELWRSERNISNRLTAIESSRCSASDCSVIRTAVVALENKITSVSQGFEARYPDLLHRISKLESRIETAERDVWKLEQSLKEKDGSN